MSGINTVMKQIRKLKKRSEKPLENCCVVGISCIISLFKSAAPENDATGRGSNEQCFRRFGL